MDKARNNAHQEYQEYQENHEHQESQDHLARPDHKVNQEMGRAITNREEVHMMTDHHQMEEEMTRTMILIDFEESQTGCILTMDKPKLVRLRSYLSQKMQLISKAGRD